jgi:hypothetical protein
MRGASLSVERFRREKWDTKLWDCKTIGMRVQKEEAIPSVQRIISHYDTKCHTMRHCFGEFLTVLMTVNRKSLGISYSDRRTVL